jgi:hypothetical protein
MLSKADVVLLEEMSQYITTSIFSYSINHIGIEQRQIAT